MRLLTSFYALALARVTLGLRFDLQGRSISPFNANTLAATGDDHSDSISSTSDVLYIANVTIDGTSYPLQMDTGSSDLWVQTGSTPANVVSFHLFRIIWDTFTGRWRMAKSTRDVLPRTFRAS